MLTMLKRLIDLNVVLGTRVKSERLYQEAQAHLDAKEYKIAFPILKESADLGYKHALVQVAMMLLRGQGISPNWTDAVAYLERAIDAGVGNVHIILGMAYGIGGYGLKRDVQRAEYHFEQSRDVDKDPEAASMLNMVAKRKGPFGNKEVARPAIPWG